MSGWQDSFQPVTPPASGAGWQDSFQAAPPSPQTGGVANMLAAPMDIASKGGAQLISNMAAPFMSDQSQQTLRSAGLYDVKHPEIENPFVRGVAESPLGAYNQATYGAIAAPVAPIMQGAQDLAKKAGVSQNALDLVNMAGNIAGVAGPPNPTAKVATISMPQEASNKGGILTNNQGAPPSFSPASVPPEFSALKNLPNATSGTTFGAMPKSLQVGLDANQKISEAYGAASAKTAASANVAKAEGSDFVVTAPELYQKLDDVTSSLADKVAPGTKEQAALSQLQDLQKALKEKYGMPEKEVSPESPPNYATSSTPKPAQTQPAMDAYGISPSDLLDIRQAINSGLSGNKIVKAGGAKLLDFKGYVSDALDTASQIKPSFGDALKQYDANWANQAGKFLNNKELDPFWKQEDYIAWKAKQNNPAQPGLTDATRSRAATFLDNLNNQKAGRASAVASVLPPEYSTQLFKNAIINTKKEPMGWGQIASDIHVTKPLKTVAQIARKVVNPAPASPLTDLASQIRQMGTQ